MNARTLVLALRELEAAARLRLAVLLSLDHGRVAGEEAAALEGAAQVGLEGHERLGNSVAHGTGLTGESATGDGAGDVVLPRTVGGDERLLDQHAQYRAGEIDVDLAGIDDDLA